MILCTICPVLFIHNRIVCLSQHASVGNNACVNVHGSVRDVLLAGTILMTYIRN